MDIGWAIDQLKSYKQVTRLGWNGKNMFLVYVPGGTVKLREGTPYFECLPYSRDINGPIEIGSHIDIYTSDGVFQPGWLASQADLLATDWELY